MTRHGWAQLPNNPMELISNPGGWSIIKRAQFDYELHRDDSSDPKPVAVNRDWQALAEMADKATEVGT